MNRPVLLLALVAVAVPAAAAVPQPGEFRANIKPEITQVNPADYQFLARYFYGGGEFEWCWSQPVLGWADQVELGGDWVFCGPETLIGQSSLPSLYPDKYQLPGIIQTPRGEIYTLTQRLSAWEEETLQGFGGLTRFFGGTGEYNYALGWSTDRPNSYPPSSWTRSQGAVEVLEEGTQAHPYFPAGFPNPEGMTWLKFPAQVPGHIGPGSSFFIWEAKKGWSYRFSTTLGTLDDSLIAVWGHIEGPDECDCPSREKCMGYWWEDDGLWDGEGSDLRPPPAPADCTYFMEVLDWGRPGTTGTGTYILWAEEYPPLPGTDSDSDGVEDDSDVCPGTTIPESVPTVSFEYNRYALTDNDGIFDSIRAPDAGPGPTFTIEDTAGCSCEQIVESTGERLAQLKYGCTVKTMREWVEAVSP